MIDYLIVGAGLSGCVSARELTDKGYSCLIIERRDYIGGNCYTEMKDGIPIHKHGVHVFHTNNKAVWDYLNEYTTVNKYMHKVKCSYKDKLYTFPVNKNTLKEMKENKITDNMENVFYKGYSEKQWNRKYKNIPKSIMRRIPVRDDYDDRYFTDKYQGVPDYTKLFRNLTQGINIELKCKYNNDIASKNIIYTGAVDDLYDYYSKKLNYRSLRFETELINTDSYQECAQINYSEKKIPYTRIIEHKKLYDLNSNKTYITKEYPANKGEKYYPVNTKKNIDLYENYKKMACDDGYILLGRLAEYKYINMDECISNALERIKCL